ncbi:MAG: DMT family transporter [Bacteroidales bacterium]|nr:DMT family transporter [Bacteroidales bacterium]
MPRNKAYIYVLVLLAVTFWGLSYVWTKMAFEYYRPISVMFVRLSVASLIMWGIVNVMRNKQKVERSDYKTFVILSFFSPFCYFIGENFGVFHVSPTLAAVIIATIPVFSPLVAYFGFREKISAINVLGFILSFLGITIMVLDADFRFTASPIGLFWLFFAVLSALINVIFLKKLAVKYSSFTIIRVQNLLGALFFLPLFLIMDFREFVHVRPSPDALAALLALAVFGSTLAFMFFTSGVRAIGIARTSIFTNLIPVVTAVTSFLLLKEVIDLSKIIGMLIVIGGLLMTQITRLRNRKRLLKK